jgi:hypothetical protein
MIHVMLTIQLPNTITIYRHLSLDLPKIVPVGQTTLIIGFANTQKTTMAKPTLPPTLSALKQQAAEKTAKRIASGRKPFEGLYGCFKNSKTFEGDPVTIVRRQRDEW